MIISKTNIKTFVNVCIRLLLNYLIINKMPPLRKKTNAKISDCCEFRPLVRLFTFAFGIMYRLYKYNI